MFMILFAAIIFIIGLVVMIYTGFPGTPSYLGWKLSGIWANQSDTLQIMIHSKDSYLHGHVVSAQVAEPGGKIVIGSMVVNNVKLKPVWSWSSGFYTDPYTLEEFRLRMRMLSDHKLKVLFVKEQRGQEQVVKEEEWSLVNPL